MCVELHTVAASNNRVHPTRSLYYCLFAPHIYIVVLAHILFVVNHTFNTTPPERLQHYQAYCTLVVRYLLTIICVTLMYPVHLFQHLCF